MYTILDEMSMQKWETICRKKAFKMAFEYQCVLMLDGIVIKDFSCF